MGRLSEISGKQRSNRDVGVYAEILKLGALQRLVQRGSDSHRSGSHAVQIASEGIEIL